MAEEKISAIDFGEEYDKQEFGLIDDGKYEVVIDKVEAKVAKTGSKYLNFRFSIRTDVEQNFKNRKLFYTVGKKEGDVCYDFPRVNKIILTQAGLPTYKDHFDEFDEVIQYLHGLHLIITVETQFDNYKGEDVNVVKDWSFEPSVFDRTEPATEHGTIEVIEDEQPAAVTEEVKPETPSEKKPTDLPDGVEEDDLPF